MNTRHEQATHFFEVSAVSPQEQAQRMYRFWATKPTCARHPDRRAICVRVKKDRILALCKTCEDAFTAADMDPMEALRNDPGDLSRALKQQLAFNEFKYSEQRS